MQFLSHVLGCATSVEKQCNMLAGVGCVTEAYEGTQRLADEVKSYFWAVQHGVDGLSCLHHALSLYLVSILLHCSAVSLIHVFHQDWQFVVLASYQRTRSLCITTSTS